MEPLNLPALAKRIPDEASAYEFMEQLRWGDEPVCPHCGVVGGHYYLKPRDGERRTRTGAVTHRRLWKCHACRKQFSALTGTIFHRTKVPVRTWLFVLFEMVASKNGVSAREVERKYGLTPRTAWFVTHRVREAMRVDPLVGLLAGTVEADETYIGGKAHYRHHGRGAFQGVNKTPVFTVVERGSGQARSRVMPTVDSSNIHRVLSETVDRGSVLNTDQARYYVVPARAYARHDRVNHSEREYVRGDAHTNTVEGFFSQLKRSLDGTHHKVSVEHLDRYLAEFDYRYTTRKMSDSQRMRDLAGRVARRRLTYRESPSEPSASSLVA